MGSLWASSRLDPNGYYRTLGLDSNTSIGMTTIKDRYRDLIKKYHPDGWEPNKVMFEKVQIAYEVIGNPESRAKYDALEPGQEWPDKFVLQRIQKETKNLEQLKLINDMLESVVKKRKPPAKDYVKQFQDVMRYNEMVKQQVVVPTYDNEVMYYYEEEGLPDMKLWDSIVASIKKGMWSLRIREGVRLGYTTQPTHIVKKSWGEVLMVDGEPDDSTELVRSYLFPEHRVHIIVINDV